MSLRPPGCFRWALRSSTPPARCVPASWMARRCKSTSLAAVCVPQAGVSRLTSGTACWVRGDVSAAGWGPAPGLATPVFIHPAQCWVIRKCNIAVTSSLKTSSLSNLTCQLHPSRRRGRHTNAERPEGAGPVAGGAAAAYASCLVTSVGCDSTESTTSLPLSTPAICLRKRGQLWCVGR